MENSQNVLDCENIAGKSTIQHQWVIANYKAIFAQANMGYPFIVLSTIRLRFSLAQKFDYAVIMMPNGFDSETGNEHISLFLLLLGDPPKDEDKDKIVVQYKFYLMDANGESKNIVCMALFWFGY